MKLVFPGNEHDQVPLVHGVHRIGRSKELDVVLDLPGVEPHHADVMSGPAGVSLNVQDGAEATVNGRPVHGLIALRIGDEIGLGGVQARLVAVTQTVAGVPAQDEADVRDEVAATTVRPVAPRHALRGLAGEVFGRSQPVHAPLLVGRADDAGLRLEGTGISRQHARLTPTEEGLIVEDMGSANGTFLNGRRITREIAHGGDELAFDTLRFQVVAPGPGDVPAEAAPAGSRVPMWVWPALLVLVLAALWMLLR